MYQQKSSILSDQEISQKLEIYISGRNLQGLGSNRNPNTYLIAYLEEPEKPKKQILKTKVYNNTMNPNFVETIIVQFVFEVKQKLTFEIFSDEKPAKLIGRLETSVGQIFGSPSNGFIKPIVNQQGLEKGKIILRCQKIEKGKKKTLFAQIVAENIPNFTWWYFFGGTFPFFRIYRKRKNDELLIYESQVLTHTLNPSWKQFSISQQKLCHLNEKMQIQVKFYSFQNSGNHQVIGSAYFTLQQAKIDKKIPIILKNDANRGKMIFKSIRRTIKHDFGEYIQNGLQLALTTCIDFTGSNGNPESTTSLHHFTPSKKSQYQQAMSQVLDILMQYDYDKLVPCFGFGAQVTHPKINTNGKVHHCFPINCNPDNPNIYQKQNILKTYRSITKSLKFSGPTKFSQLIRSSIQICHQFEKNSQKTQYMILFILTDGEIHDKMQVIDLIVKCNKLPISIIIVGIGNGTFQIMYELDDDDCKMIDSMGNRTTRDLVQFVEFKKFKNNSVALAREVLEELPRQVQEYFQHARIQPSQMKRRKADIEEQMWLMNSSANS